MTGSDAVLAAEGVVLRLGARDAVAGVSVALCAAQWVAIVGPNGAGKSSLLSLLAGLRRPDAGSVRLQGRPIAGWPARERALRLAWLAQHGEADGEIAVADVVRLGRLPRHGLLGAAGADDKRAVATAMAEMEVAPLAARRLSALSGGERQRVLLARLLATEAGILLLDEPTAHLDAPHQRDLLRSLAARARSGAAVATVLHDLTQALAADRLLVMDRGRLVADGAPGDPALHAALVEVFAGALRIERFPSENGRPRWIAVPHA